MLSPLPPLKMSSWFQLIFLALVTASRDNYFDKGSVLPRKKKTTFLPSFLLFSHAFDISSED
jgi:hypothetical protein